MAECGDDQNPRAERPSAEVPEDTDTPATRVSFQGVRASLFPRRTGGHTSSGPSTIIRAADAMRGDEIQRTRQFFVIIAVLIAGCWALLPFIEGDTTAKWIFAGGLLAYLVSMAVFVVAISRDPSAFRERNFWPSAICGVFAGYGGVYFFGVFSAAPAAIVMALYFNSLLGSFRYTFAVYLACAGVQALLAGLIMMGVIRDVGLLRADDVGLVGQIATQGLIQLALLATFLVGRVSRRSTQESIHRFEDAVREVAQREALLNEARQELERAAWVGGPGRFTEQQIGSYKLGLIIGRGAMGEVYEGLHIETGDVAAVKLLHRNVLSDASQVARFAREAEAVSRLDSPHVVKVYEVADPSSPVPYIAMERMVGDDLAALLRRRRRLSLDEVVEIAEQIAAGIDAAAEAGIVHRDLKPQNLLYHRDPDGNGQWKILDFGVSKLADGTGTLTRGRVVGTPTYMAPEQARGKEVDSRADVYALAAIAYRALTGHPCFTGNEIPKILYDVVHKMPERPSKLVPDLPLGVDMALAVGLAKKPRDRFATAGELAAALRGAQISLTEELRQRASKLVPPSWRHAEG